MNHAVTFFSTKTQFENLGDALINREMIRLATKHSRQLVVDTSRAPEWFIKILDIPSKARKVRGTAQLFFLMLAHRLRREPSYYFLCPGGMGGDLSYNGMLTSYLKLAVFSILCLIGIKICHVGVSFDTPGPRLVKYLQLRNRFLHRFYVRDVSSSQLLDAFNIPHHGILPDLAFNLFSESGMDRPVGGERVCLSFRTDQYPEQLGDIKKFVEQLLGLFTKSTEILMLVQVGRDEPGMRELSSWIQSKCQNNIVLHINSKNIEDNLKALSTCRHVFSNRLHVLLLGARACRSMIACVGPENKKIIGLFNTLDFDRALLDISKPLSADAFQQALALEFEGHSYYKQLNLGFGLLYAS